MRIAIVGGTGKEGSGLGFRWATAGHDDRHRLARRRAGAGKAAELAATSARRPRQRHVQRRRREGGGRGRAGAARERTCGRHSPRSRDACRGKVVISTVVPLSFGGGRLFTPPAQGSSAEEAQELLGPEARVVAAFHHIAAHELRPAIIPSSAISSTAAATPRRRRWSETWPPRSACARWTSAR